MRRCTILPGLTILLAIALMPAAGGHGGAYQGPGGSVPPNSGGSGDTAPPSHSGSSASSAASGSSPPPPTPMGTPAGRKGRLGGLAKRGGSGGFEQWEYWWATNKEPYRERLYSSGTAGDLLGPHTSMRLATMRASLEDVKQEIVPRLLRLLDEDDADIVDSAVLALARTVPSSEADLVFDAIVKTLAHRQETARQSATLSLGVLGSVKARPILRHLVLNTAEGRRYLANTRAVPSLIRGFAALSLGYLAHEDDLPLLMSVIDEPSDAERDLKSCALLALGLYETRVEEIAAFLLDVMRRTPMDRALRSLAPISLSRLETTVARVAGLAPVLQLVRAERTDDDMMRSCVIALGKMATMGDTEVLDALQRVISEHRDAQTRHLALVALGEIGAHDGPRYAEHSTAHARLQQLLLAALRDPQTKAHQPWAALALGIYARAYRGSAEHVGFLGSAITSLTEAFRETSNPSYRGAMAIALGIMGAAEVAAELFATLVTCRDSALSGHIAVGLGLMGYGDAAGKLRELIGSKGQDWLLRLDLARALALLGDVQSLATLTKLLGEATSIYETASLAQAIGLIGDRGAIDRLTAIFEDPNRPGLLRGFAAVAIGLLAEKSSLPWNARIATRLNYRAQSEAIAEVLDIL
ncbi:MAG: hypothetical protein AB1486_15370 [Planctomycetota bacterium]